MKHTARLGLLVTFLLFLASSGSAQENYTAYTTKDGLPSNYIYRTLEDNNGFLWVATDAGLARFDGKNFQLYTTADGLPDNAVFYLQKEKDGTVWVNCYNQIPAYFDEVQNRFVVPCDEKDYAKIINTFNTNLYPLKAGGVAYATRDSWIVFRNKKIKSYGKLAAAIEKSAPIAEMPDGSLLTTSVFQKNDNLHYLRLCHVRGEELIDSTTIGAFHIYPGSRGAGTILYNGDIYTIDRNSQQCRIYSNFKTNPIRYHADSIQVPEPYQNCFVTDKEISFVATSGTLYVFDRNSKKLIQRTTGDFLLNSYFRDSKGNEWYSTIDKGLVTKRDKRVKRLTIPNTFQHTNFMSVVRKKDGTVLAGNYYGEVLEIKNNQHKIHKIIDKAPARIRKILLIGPDVYTFSEEGIYRNYKQKIQDADFNRLSFAKCAISFNDTTILLATNRNISAIHTKTYKMYSLSPFKRVTALAKADSRYAYFGSTDGLYKYDFINDTSIALHEKSPLLKERIAALCYTSDGLLWVSTSGNDLVVLKNDRVISNVVFNRELINSSNKNLTQGKPGEMWVATSGGINRIRYRYKSGTFTYSNKSFSVIDGLSSNDVQELYYDNGIIYAASGNGLSMLPEDYDSPENNIPTHLVSMQINQKIAPIQTGYLLDHRPQDIRMEFSGVDLNGYFKHFQYKLDDSDRWMTLDQNTLVIQLRTGTHILKVRAVDVSGNASKKILVLKFEVATPFWKNYWFWIINGILAQLIIIWLISRYQKQKREAKLSRKFAEVQAAAIEQQAFTSLMNPHFIFNSLNSIQYYINRQDRKNANRYLSDFASLIRRNFEAAQQSFISLEEEIENIKLYLSLEKMRFNERLEYEVQVDEAVDPEEWMIPTMILQPLLENALLHGLMPSTLAGKIWVRFMHRETDLLIIVADNGIGIKNSLALNDRNNHKSRGTELIEKRVQALRHFGETPISMSMHPAFDSETNPGNKVTILVPQSLYESWRRTRSV